jgi:hypothetical protein
MVALRGTDIAEGVFRLETSRKHDAVRGISGLEILFGEFSVLKPLKYHRQSFQ